MWRTVREREKVCFRFNGDRKREGYYNKAQTVKLKYKSKSGKEYILKDTPGHVDLAMK